MIAAGLFITREAVRSSNVAELGYDAVNQVLEVAFHPRKDGVTAVWRYTPVTQEQYDELRSAASIGGAFAVFKKLPGITGELHAYEEPVV